MWKVSSMYSSDDNMTFILVDVNDEDHRIEVDKFSYQVLEDMGLIIT